MYTGDNNVWQNTIQQICHPDEYLLTIDIEEVTLVKQREYDYSSCEEAYAIGLQQKISLPK